ncbi:transaldolase [Nitrincola tapanii]|uniref:Transaldolase n=1 Tax=Nitrincola tapanii TaxID=1708751 RepID=A0A5A9W5B7_9GAMM|nr:transaldolase [Nitrincola tapanii]KAA0875278.1 transaldolase [Nitrincola tapanii]
MNQLEQLKQMTQVVADTGDIAAIAQFCPVDATTNPSLILKASEDPKYAYLLQDAKHWARAQGGTHRDYLSNLTDRLAVQIGHEILKLIPGRISTEVDARLSFNTQATLEKARRLIHLYEEMGISRDRVLIKIASTWEGIAAARQLEKEKIQCNLTLLFGFSQAQACADAGAFLISPFVGRILDWYKKAQPEMDFTGDQDPGVASVTRIYNYYKQNGYSTIVMGASFRNLDEIRCLAGCDRLTISPALMQELALSTDPLEQRLSAASAQSNEPAVGPSESEFRWALNEDAMATEKLAEGIRNFARDQEKLERLLSAE